MPFLPHSFAPFIYCLYQVSSHRIYTASADEDRGEEDTSKRRAYHLNRMPFLPHPRLPLQTNLLPLLGQ